MIYIKLLFFQVFSLIVNKNNFAFVYNNKLSKYYYVEYYLILTKYVNVVLEYRKRVATVKKYNTNYL